MPGKSEVSVPRSSEHCKSGKMSESPDLSTLESELVCPVCHGVPRNPPIYQCLQGTDPNPTLEMVYDMSHSILGHLVCQRCEPKCWNCPICRQEMGLPIRKRIRNLMAEKVKSE